MRVYVAGKTQDIRTVRLVQKIVTATGHKITMDWTKVVEANGGGADEVEVPLERRQKAAQDDMAGVYLADLVIAVGHPQLCGTLWECGAALMSNTPLWLVEWHRSKYSIFQDHPHVQQLDIGDLPDKLWKVSPKRVEQLPPPIMIRNPGGGWEFTPCQVPNCPELAIFNRREMLVCDLHAALWEEASLG